MKKIIAFLLIAVMLLSLTACGGGEAPDKNSTPPASTTSNEKETAEKPEESAPGNTEGKSIVTQYGSDPDYEVYTATIYCPEGAAFDEDEYAEYLADGYVNDFSVYDEVRDYSTYSHVYWSLDIYTNDTEIPTGYGVLQQLYFDGELAPETEAEYPTYEQTVTDLGFQWEDKDVKLIETTYTSVGGYEYSETFVGVEYTHYYWEVNADGKVEEGLTAPGLFGFQVTGWDLTEDQYAWIAGQLFGVDSGRTWALESEEESEPPVVNVNAAELLGTWLQRDSDWDDTFIFNADGTGVVISGPEYPFTYAVKGDILTLTYDDGEQEEFAISVDGDLLTMIDKWDEELLLDKQTADEPKSEPDKTETATPAEPTLKELIIGTWEDQETAYKETFTFNEDGTGKYSFEDNGHWEYTFTYAWYDGDYVEFVYDDDGSVGGFTVRIEGDVMYLSNLSVVDMPLVRK